MLFRVLLTFSSTDCIQCAVKPFSFPSLELGITLEPKSDGTYQLKDLYGCLNPPENKFFEAFNSVRWSILRLVQNDTRTPGPNAVDRILVDEVEGVQLRLEVSELLVLRIQYVLSDS